ncbi:MAG: hypothetical protein BGP06_21275 [Rhizobiales bacterium 65-9]|nr:hypothetical protein [Hyphomicrobiales bacterium]OJY36540.1 MAG: hypothetical protein BGP06_21275 [Rhizobiales bacterium 65-9]
MSSLSSLPGKLRQAVATEFVSQPVIWVGRPNPRRVFWPALGIWLFAIPWTAFALFWEWVVLGSLFFAHPRGAAGPPSGLMWVFALFGAPFVLVGLGMLAAPFWMAREARRTVYALSTQRLATLIVNRATKATSISVGDIAGTRRIEKTDRSGDLTVITGWTRDSDGDRVEMEHKLVGVPAVRQVEDKLLALRDSRRQR